MRHFAFVILPVLALGISLELRGDEEDQGTNRMQDCRKAMKESRRAFLNGKSLDEMKESLLKVRFKFLTQYICLIVSIASGERKI